MKMTIFFVAMLFTLNTFSQEHTVPVCLNKTTTLIFPNQDLMHVDIGANQGIGFQQDDSIPGMLKLRINELFPAINMTNLLVVTRNNHVYSFNVIYQSDIKQNVFTIPDSLAINYRTHELCPDTKVNLSEQDTLFDMLTNDDRYLPKILCDKQGKIILSINSIYTQDERFYFSCLLTNYSNLTYQPNFYNMFITPSKKLKATVVQDIPVKIEPFRSGLPKTIEAHSSQKFIFSTSKYTMESGHITVFEVYEQEGGRHLEVKINNTILLEAFNLKNRN